ncbi:MAG: hypothetical protein DMF56_27655 [Acidobacteria bacterium]|nr:MAG: hypothetical protein DMF56_27655 [Acidobacteriota bacterium]
MVIQDRFRVMRSEADAIYDAALLHFTTNVPLDPEVRITGDTTMISLEETAQALGFVVRVKHLRDEDMSLRFGNDWSIENLWELRQILNDLRPIIQNQRDSTFYTKLNSTLQRRIRKTSPPDGVCYQMYDRSSGNNVSAEYATYLAETTQAIGTILGRLECDYLFNGILQHSEPRHSARLVADYASGEFNYVLWKHALVVTYIQERLDAYYHVLKELNFPPLRPLCSKVAP